MITTIFILSALLCAVQAIRVRQLISAALWLAGVSASVAVVMYQLGAPDVAVIELSVGAGLVTILFVFAISVAGADDLNHQPVVPRYVPISLLVIGAAVLSWLLFPLAPMSAGAAVETRPFSVIMWEVRGLDVLLQIGLIFGAVMCILGLLGEETHRSDQETEVSHHTAISANGHEQLATPAHLFEKEEIAG